MQGNSVRWMRTGRRKIPSGENVANQLGDGGDLLGDGGNLLGDGDDLHNRHHHNHDNHVFASVCSSSRHRERLKSDSCVAFDQENRHHHHRHTFQPDRLCVVLHQLPSNEQNHNQIMGNDRIEVKNNESLMQYYHLMVVAVKI